MTNITNNFNNFFEYKKKCPFCKNPLTKEVFDFFENKSIISYEITNDYVNMVWYCDLINQDIKTTIYKNESMIHSNNETIVIDDFYTKAFSLMVSCHSCDKEYYYSSHALLGETKVSPIDLYNEHVKLGKYIVQIYYDTYDMGIYLVNEGSVETIGFFNALDLREDNGEEFEKLIKIQLTFA